MTLDSEALVDLYDLVQVVNDDQGIDGVYRVTAIDHEITPHKWVMSVEFEPDGVAAPPQVVPKP